MGSRKNNFYNDLAIRYGYEEAAKSIQDLYLSVKRNEAVAAVPDGLVDEIALVGPKGRIADQLDAWTASPVTTLILRNPSSHSMEVLAGLLARASLDSKQFKSC